MRNIWWLVKIFTIIFAGFLVNDRYGSDIQFIFKNDNSTIIDKGSQVIRLIFDIPDPQLSQTDQEIDIQEIKTSSQPNKLDVSNPQAFEYAKEISDDFNASQNHLAITQAFIDLQPDELGADGQSIQVGRNLLEGGQTRVSELTDYNYFSNLTKDGQDFRSLYSSIPNAQFRIGEQLYELYLIADDIRLQAWKQPQILAEFLKQSLGQEIQSQEFTHQLITVRLAPTAYIVNDIPYVRLVAVRTFYR